MARAGADAGPWLLGVDVGGTKLLVGGVQPHGQVLGRVRLPMAEGGHLRTPHQVVEAVVRAAASGGAAAPAAIGVSVAAAVAPDGRSLTYAPNLPGWVGAELAPLLEGAVGAPARLVYDGHAALLGEAWLGAARRVPNVLLAVVGTGLGGAVLAGGRLVEGSDRLAGVLGWMPVPDPDQGGVVPLEQRVAGPALARRASAARGIPTTPEELFAACRQGEGWAQPLLASVLEELALALSAATSLLNPDRILLAGGVGLALADYAPYLEQRIRNTAQPLAGARVQVTRALLGADAGWLGAARTAWLALRSEPPGAPRP